MRSKLQQINVLVQLQVKWPSTQGAFHKPCFLRFSKEVLGEKGTLEDSDSRWTEEDIKNLLILLSASSNDRETFEPTSSRNKQHKGCFSAHVPGKDLLNKSSYNANFQTKDDN